ncbi:MAG: tetraacyldisaccharide 4'-kinase [Magnetococcales bacterium]|nr:tetraacyldisaccharide 4'-kinase [Magnetococcales bacterium]
MTTPLLPILAGERPPQGFYEKAMLRVLQIISRPYGAIQRVRATLYKNGVFSTYTAPCPVISVGNITTGGTGKTPTVIWLAKYFQNKGRKVGVVSRGYKQQSKAEVTVVANPEKIVTTTPQAADEAVLIAQTLPGVTVITGPKRNKTIHVATQQYGCDLIIMDDAFQHMQVKRDFDLVLLDCNNPLSNGNILPGGLLREHPYALHRCDGIIITRADNLKNLNKTQDLLKEIVPNIKNCPAIHKPTNWRKLINTGSKHPAIMSIDGFKNFSVLAFCGIAKPENFYATLDELAISPLACISYGDHHMFDDNTIDKLQEKAKSLEAQVLLCTEKDAVKLHDITSELPIYALSMELNFPEISPWLQQKLDTI